MAKAKSNKWGGKRDGFRCQTIWREDFAPSSLMVRSSPEWKATVEAFAEWDRAPSVSDLVDRAIVAYARERGYEKAFPKR